MLIAVGVVIVFVWAYVLFIRDWLYKELPGTAYSKWYDIETKFWSASRTILVARGYTVAGILLSIQSLIAASGVDVSPFVNELAKLIPEHYRGLAIGLFFILTGIGFSWLRKVTSAPLGMTADKDQTPPPVIDRHPQ